MSGNAFFLVMLAAIVVLIVLQLFRRSLKRKANEWGRSKGEAYAAKRIPAAIKAFGQTVVLATDPARAQHVVAEVAAANRKVDARGDGRWGMAVIEDDDLVLTLATSAEASVLSVESFREHFGLPHGASQWNNFADKVIERAQAAGVTMSRGVRGHERSTPIDDKNYRWVAAGRVDG